MVRRQGLQAQREQASGFRRAAIKRPRQQRRGFFRIAERQQLARQMMGGVQIAGTQPERRPEFPYGGLRLARP